MTRIATCVTAIVIVGLLIAGFLSPTAFSIGAGVLFLALVLLIFIEKSEDVG